MEFVSTAIAILIIFIFGIVFGALLVMFIGGYTRPSRDEVKIAPNHIKRDSGK